MYGNALDTQDALYESRPFPYSSAMVVKVDASMWRGIVASSGAYP
jgi:hypothetical protein